MQDLRRLLQSPSALLAFEAAGRHLSFSGAAAELNLTQAAISYSIKRLETALGVTLFTRAHRAVTLTEAGERFFHDVSIGLAHIRRSADAIRREREPGHVTLSVSTAFASYWMVPRLARFHAALPHIDLRLQTVDKDIDLAREAMTLGVRRGDGNWPQFESVPLAREEIYAVASAAYAAAIGAPVPPSRLPELKLIHLDEPYRPRPSWTDWFTALGVRWSDRGEGLRLNDYALVLQAVLEGEGIAMGWRHVTEGMIARGSLRRVCNESFVSGQDFHVVWPKGALLAPDTAEVRDWLLAQAVV
ncbi:LysR substrate-binding domain-containing protein [Hypericibacter sp.]|uniref:LysR substrate-binding domain-containing protein n=1 Tax=Hypericibacter sp. TaxID=2705401 RepID=UPI003D6CD1EE